jgi:putative hydrolase of the HAD superfamily
MAWDAVLFDLFDTLVRFDRARLPEITVKGRSVRSTAGSLHETLQRFCPAIGLDDFADALFWSWQDAERVRQETHREVTAPERFATLVGRLGLDPAGLADDAIPALLATHMRELSRVVVFPPHHRALLEGLRRTHRLGVVSNFDYTPTAELVLERAGVAGLLDVVVISDAVGWRKPSPVIFEEALRRIGVSAGRTMFVGDRADIDVAGARGVGMAAVWINPGRAALPAGGVAPEFEIEDLAELEAIVADGRP